MTGIWFAAMVALLMAIGVASQLGWELRPMPLSEWVAKRMRDARRAPAAEKIRNA
jgi:hypothetical protein